MTAHEMIEKLLKVPENATVLSDSAWECDATVCAAVFYSELFNTVVLTQEDGKGEINYRSSINYKEI